MPVNDTISQPAQRHINWGGVLKGVAIVTAVAVAAVVGYWALWALSDYVTTAIVADAGGASALAAGIHSGAVAVAEGAGWLAGSAVNLISSIPAGLASILGLSGTFTQAAAVNSTVATIGGAVAAGTALHAGIPALQHTNYVIDAPVPSTHADAGMLANTMRMHDITHMTHHAAEHASEPTAAAWSNKFTPRAASGSFADNVLAQKEERKAVQPSQSFTEQLNSDRANLDAALAK